MTTQYAIKNGERVELSAQEYAEFAKTQVSEEQAALSALTNKINSEVEARIVKTAPLWKQQNLTAHRLSVLTKRMEGSAVTAEEEALFQEAVSVAQKIEALRQVGNNAIKNRAVFDQIVWPITA